MAKLWASNALSPHGNPYGGIVVVAETRDEALALARQALARETGTYVPAQRYVANLLDSLDLTLEEVPSGVVIDWEPVDGRRR